MKTAISKRLKDFLRHENISQEDLRRNIGVKNRQQVSSWFLGAENIPDKHILSIIRTYPQLNANWLINEKGEMLNDPQEMAKHALKESAFCEDCIMKEGKIEYMKELLDEKDKKFDKVSQKVGELTAKLEACQDELEGSNKANVG